ncbi:hypothetical protein QTP88_025952 [Uroleucon formosanum]
MKPIEVNNNNEYDLLNSVYNYDISNSVPKFEINDRVRLSSIVDVYRNKLKTNWSKEIFKSNVNYYKIKDIEGRTHYAHWEDCDNDNRLMTDGQTPISRMTNTKQF